VVLHETEVPRQEIRGIDDYRHQLVQPRVFQA
jgi:hypothetical protein